MTPTGAALLAHLVDGRPACGKICRCGHGRGTRDLPGRANVLRIVVLETVEATVGRDEVVELAFEIDDQPAEDLALGLERLRAMSGVCDIVQIPVFGKKGRMATAVRLLVRPEHRDSVVDACFAETTTLGLRVTSVERIVLARRQCGPVKLAHRPSGEVTGKAEIDALDGRSAAARDRQRAELVERALREQA